MHLNDLLTTHHRIQTNALLRTPEPGILLDDLLAVREVALHVGPTGPDMLTNLASVQEEDLRDIHARYGPAGLYRVQFLASTGSPSEFGHFHGAIADHLRLRRAVAAAGTQMREPELACDNATLPADERLRHFAWNLLNPALSRKLYNPGSRHGYTVYGFGGPRILVSHPFLGRTGEHYDVYRNSLDVLTSLMVRGFEGSFLFLDLLPGLDGERHGVPEWLLWFSVIACHSDLVLFVQGADRELGPAQQLEVSFTPDTVQKKTVTFPDDELRWAQAPDVPDDVPVELYIGQGGQMSREEYLSHEASLARPFVDAYERDRLPADRFVVVGDGGSVTEFPLDHPRYGYHPLPPTRLVHRRGPTAPA